MAKKQCKGWKVIRRKDRQSCTGHVRPEASVTYIKNKEVKRREKHGPLAVFETREAARKFIANRIHPTWHKKYWRIVKCKYTESQDKGLWDQYFNSGSGYSIRRETNIGCLPPRTAFADSVTCLE